MLEPMALTAVITFVSTISIILLVKLCCVCRRHCGVCVRSTIEQMTIPTHWRQRRRPNQATSATSATTLTTPDDDQLMQSQFGCGQSAPPSAYLTHMQRAAATTNPFLQTSAAPTGGTFSTSVNVQHSMNINNCVRQLVDERATTTAASVVAPEKRLQLAAVLEQPPPAYTSVV